MHGPRLAVSAGVWRGDRVLLIRRARPPLAGLWTFPGGGVEPGERVADAVVREVLEETGLAVSPLGEPLLHEIILSDDAGLLLGHHVLLVHAAIMEGEAEPVAASDAAEARFVAPEAIVGLPTTDRLAHFIAETRRMVEAWRRGAGG